jgi:Rrf2 family protein
MRLTNRSEYALLALIFLARDPDSYFHADEIAGPQGIPKRFLQQILQTLKGAGLVKSIKGKDGGYALARDPSKISLAEVVRLFEGALAPSKSVSKYFYESTPIEREKRMVSLLSDIRKLISDKLEKTFLSDVL